ncbi:MAG: hypothetical protein LBG48_03305 [Rickettsiales bacterium]|jgi:hypothetical protein|nr:hypothetical protein [Rickettsiales bacterium]
MIKINRKSSLNLSEPIVYVTNFCNGHAYAFGAPRGFNQAEFFKAVFDFNGGVGNLTKCASYPRFPFAGAGLTCVFQRTLLPGFQSMGLDGRLSRIGLSTPSSAIMVAMETFENSDKKNIDYLIIFTASFVIIYQSLGV